MTRTITVTGRSEQSVCPDLARLTLEVREERALSREAADACGARTEALLAALRPLLPQGAVKTVSLRTDVRRDEHGHVTAYIASRRLLAECRADAGTVASLIDAALQSGAEPLLSLSYVLRDPAKKREALLKEAVRDARKKARAIAEAAGVTLGALVGVTYAQPSAVPFRTLRMASHGDFGADLTPDDVTLSDEVTAVYEIE